MSHFLISGLTAFVRSVLDRNLALRRDQNTGTSKATIGMMIAQWVQYAYAFTQYLSK